MENKNSFTIVGIFTTLVGILVICFIWWMTTRSDSNVHYTTYYIHTKELPNGLKEGSSVKYIGVPAGYVKDIHFAQGSDYGVIEIAIDVQNDFPIKKNSIATTEIQGISGLTTLNLSKGDGENFSKNEKPILYLDKSFLSKFNSEAKAITTGVSDAIKKVNSVLDDENLQNLKQTLSSINSITSNLSNAENFAKLNSILKSLDEILAKIDKSDIDESLKNFNELVKNADNFAKNANKTALNLNKTLNLINSDLKNGNYDIKEILSPTLHETSLTLIELKKLLREFQNALFRLEDDPYDFFFRDTQKQKRSQTLD
ncbi:MlaD family protein [Campylobacter ureolyticus]|uniref:MlaD family protein n=1 Tax=Campylobacter ureolyticus TaxID=827 RepID=UPI0022B5C0F3|nr:MlaD family protein [Campylobacter ureolyticus]MCZ6132417.1 MlaD family protein [Campylobacter ureolyticus]